jgi:hypothetical protein
MVLNAFEGSRRNGKDRTYHFHVAAGSAAEVFAALRLAIAWQHCDAQPDILALLDRLLAMLWRLQHPRR